MKFKAAILHSSNQPLMVQDVTMEALQPTDVLVKMRASGLCHTELEIIQGAIHVNTPMMMGHEGAGIVEAVGDAVTRVKPGDAVVCSWNPSCGHCFYCVRNQPILCETIAPAAGKGLMPDGTSRLMLDSKPLHHFSFVASHGEYTVIAEAGAIPIPQEMPLDRACLIGCGVMTGVGGALNIARVPVGANTATFGCGIVGLSAIQGARLAGAEVNIAIDLSDERLALARALGATQTINPRVQDPLEEIRKATHGRGADFTFEAAGTVVTMQNSLEATRPGGMIVILGKVPFQDNVPFRFGSVFGEKIITRSSYGGARPERDFPLLSRLYLEGKLKLDELVTKRITLDRISETFDEMADGSILRAVVAFN